MKRHDPKLLLAAASFSLFLFATLPSSLGEVEIPIEGNFSAADTSDLPDGWKLNNAFPGKMELVDGQTEEQGIQITVEESRNPAGIVFSNRIPAQPGRYEYRFKAKGNGELLLGLSLWNGEQWIRMNGHTIRIDGTDWYEDAITVIVPEQASQADTNESAEAVAVTEIQPVILVREGTVTISNLQLFSLEQL